MVPEPEASARRILIVDDNAQFLAAARALLEREGVVVVGVASTSAEALRLAVDLAPDAILVDVDLGEESGFDLAHRLSADGVAPVVLISAYAESELVELITASPAAGFVPKSQLSASAVADLLGPPL